MRVLSKIFQVLSWVVTAVIILLLLQIAPIIFGYRPMVVLSPSMEPAYPVGSLTYYKQAAFDDIAVNDTITFTIGDGAFATHRVIAKDEQAKAFFTKGDNNPSADTNPVAYSTVVGKNTKLAIPYVGYAKPYIQSWPAIVTAGLIILGDFLLGSDNKKKQKKTAPVHSSFLEEPEESAEKQGEPAAEPLQAETEPTQTKKAKAASAEEFFKDL